MTLDDLKALAKKAKAWRPEPRCAALVVCAMTYEDDCGSCDACLGAQRACEDIAATVDVALSRVMHPPEKGTHWVDEMPPDHFARIATRIASYFGSESNPVAEFAAAVMEFCK